MVNFTQNFTKFSLDLANVTFPNQDPRITAAIIEGGLVDYVPKQDALNYVHMNCTGFGIILQISIAVCVLLLLLGVFYFLCYLKSKGDL